MAKPDREGHVGETKEYSHMCPLLKLIFGL